MIFSVTYPNIAYFSTSSGLGNLLWAILASFPFIAGSPALLIGARRSRDLVLRGSLKWLGLALLLLIAVLVEDSIVLSIPGISVFESNYSYPALPGAAMLILISYALYRSARSLAPINRLQAIEPATIPSPEPTTT